MSFKNTIQDWVYLPFMRPKKVLEIINNFWNYNYWFNACLTLFHKPIIYTVLACQKMNWCLYVFLFPICNIRMEETWLKNTAIKNDVLFQKLLKFGWPTPKPVCNIHAPIWDKVFKNGPSRICGRQPLKIFTRSILEYFVSYRGLKLLTILRLGLN